MRRANFLIIPLNELTWGIRVRDTVYGQFATATAASKYAIQWGRRMASKGVAVRVLTSAKREPPHLLWTSELPHGLFEFSTDPSKDDVVRQGEKPSTGSGRSYPLRGGVRTSIRRIEGLSRQPNSGGLQNDDEQLMMTELEELIPPLLPIPHAGASLDAVTSREPVTPQSLPDHDRAYDDAVSEGWPDHRMPLRRAP